MRTYGLVTNASQMLANDRRNVEVSLLLPFAFLEQQGIESLGSVQRTQVTLN